MTACPLPGSNFTDTWGAPRVGHSHQGVDMMGMPHGAPVLAPADGNLRPHGSGSFYLDAPDGTTYFGTHLQSVTASGPVVAGQVIGTNGSSGNASSDSPHVHFEIHPGGGAAVNPTAATAAVCNGPSPETIAALEVVAAVAPPTWPYSRPEVQRWYNRLHNPNIDRATAVRLTAYMNVVVEQRLQAYLLAVYLNAVAASQTACSGGESCASLIRSVFAERGLDGNAAVRVASCESGLNPRASNGSHDGLFQQARQYWAGRSAQYGMAGRSAFDPYANAVVSAGMVRDTGGWSHWSCSP